MAKGTVVTLVNSVMRTLGSSSLLVSVTCAAVLSAQTSSQLSLLRAEQRRAHTRRDLSVLRGAARSSNSETAVMGVRALGRLERPALVPDIAVLLRSRLPEVRAEAADAIGQAAQGWGDKAPSGSLNSAFNVLVNRLHVDDNADVRAAVCETIGRLPYTTAVQVARAESALVDAAGRNATVTDRLGVAMGLEALIRLRAARRPPGDEALEMLRSLAMPAAEEATAPRVRRLALTALIDAGSTDDELVVRSARDPDNQVRRLAMLAAATGDTASRGGVTGALAKGVTDPAVMVRIEALRSEGSLGPGEPEMCEIVSGATHDPMLPVALMAIDQLSACGSVAGAVDDLERTARDLSDASEPHGWLRPAHALVALAQAAPVRALAAIEPAVESPVWQLRMYAARAAGQVRAVLELQRLASDSDDNVREAAISELQTVAGHAADQLYIDGLSSPGYQVIRAAAYALNDSPNVDAARPALEAAYTRLVDEGHDNSESARTALRGALASLGDDPPDFKKTSSSPALNLTLDGLRRLATARARVTIAGEGTIELALLTDQAPLTVLHFAGLVESGYYNGLTFHRVVPNFVIQGGSPGANEYVGLPRFMLDEVGHWPHTRGAVGISARGRDTGDGQFFIDLVDNPRLDHEYTVFAHVLDGMEVADSVVEGDVIEKIELILGP